MAIDDTPFRRHLPVAAEPPPYAAWIAAAEPGRGDAAQSYFRMQRSYSFQ